MNADLRIAAALLTAVACNPPSERAPETSVPVPVDVVRVVAVVGGEYISAAGTTAPSSRATPSTRVTGRIVEVAFEAEDRVTAADTLVRIASDDLLAQREQAGGRLEAAAAEQVRAKADLKRIRNLFRESAATRQTLEAYEAADKRAEAIRSAAHGAVAEAEAILRMAPSPRR